MFVYFICRDSERSCYHLELDMSGSAASYEAGDHVGIYIENGEDIVDEVCRLLQHSPETVLRLQHPAGNPDRLPPCPSGESILAFVHDHCFFHQGAYGSRF